MFYTVNLVIYLVGRKFEYGLIKKTSKKLKNIEQPTMSSFAEHINYDIDVNNLGLLNVALSYLKKI